MDLLLGSYLKIMRSMESLCLNLPLCRAFLKKSLRPFIKLWLLVTLSVFNT